jgi:hypothetical protein
VIWESRAREKSAKVALVEQLQQWGLLKREGDQWKCTLQGHYAGAMLCAVALHEEAEQRAREPARTN